MVALGVRIPDMGAAHPDDSVQELRILQDSQAQLFPIPALAARDDVVNGREAEFLMIEMPVRHGLPQSSSKTADIPTPAIGCVNVKNGIDLRQAFVLFPLSLRSGKMAPWPKALVLPVDSISSTRMNWSANRSSARIAGQKRG
jgi:hypothetical protein